jgi:hypothetical protein
MHSVSTELCTINRLKSLARTLSPGLIRDDLSLLIKQREAALTTEQMIESVEALQGGTKDEQ